MASVTAITRFPEIGAVKALLRTPWNSVHAQGGRIRHQSRVYPGAWSVSSLLVRAQTDILISGHSSDVDRHEEFRLRFSDAGEEWGSLCLHSARPGFAVIAQWPEPIELPSDFLTTGPANAEIGLGARLKGASRHSDEETIPILWCRFASAIGSMTVYADNEVPLNVGLVKSNERFTAIKSDLSAVSIIHL